MSVRSRSPLRTGAANFGSGNCNTGQVNYTLGGAQKWGFNSGGLLSPGSGSPNPPAGAIVKTADQVLVFSGAGRLDSVLPALSISGTAIVLYDSAVVSRSGAGPAESGYSTLGVVPANTIGSYGVLGGGPLPINFGIPFTSGLCVSCLSGAPGCTITFTPEVDANILPA